MTTTLELQRFLTDYVEQNKSQLIEITQELVRIPSENTPPHGTERACQNWISNRLAACGLQPDVYCFSDVPELASHPLYLAGRNYHDRPNVAATKKGSGGRSLLLSGHIDTVPAGTQAWSQSPFSGAVEGGRLYGRGSNDMKAGVATNLFVMETLMKLGLQLSGDLLFESVIDEEFGGANGTLAGRLRGHNADAAILSEPSSLRICAAQRGGRTAHIHFQAPGGVLQNGRFPAGIIPQLTHFLTNLDTFAKKRQAHVSIHEMYAGHADPIPVSVTKIFTAPWGFSEPITTPESLLVELYWQLMPGETQQEVEREFFEWLTELVSGAPDVFPGMPEVNFPIRWLPGSAVAKSEPLVQELSACAKITLGKEPVIAGIEGPCDLFIFHHGFGIPAVIWGAHGGNTHAANEYVEIDSLVAAAQTLLFFAVQWCGLTE
jgi:acetylornithine deacetylase